MSVPVALITGGARRIGAELVRQFHHEGFNILVHCHQSRDAAEGLAGELNELRPDSVRIVQQNLQDPDAFDSLPEATMAAFGHLDVLVNNASAFFPTSLESVTPDMFDELINVNLRAPYFLSQKFSPHLKGGCMINIVDIYADQPLEGYSAYSISKAGLAMLTRSLAVELAPDIRVNGISPGAILWPEEGMSTDEDRQKLLDRIPMGRTGEPAAIAETAVFLATSADYITGQIIAVDGGSSI